MCSEVRTSAQAGNDAEATVSKSHLTENQCPTRLWQRCEQLLVQSTSAPPDPSSGWVVWNCCCLLQTTSLAHRPGLSQVPARGGSRQFLPPTDHVPLMNVKLLRLAP